MTQTAEFIDLSDHDAFVESVPHEAFAILRREDPVHWNPEPDGRGFWAVTRYEDIRAVHRNPQTFSSEVGGTSLEDLEPEHIEARKSMIDMDPPQHDELRAIVNRRFTPRAVTVWEEQVRKVAREVLDTALPKQEFDFVAEIASEIPMQVFAEILGVPQSERREIIEIGDRLLGNADPEYAHTGDDDAHRHLPFSSPAALDMFAFGRRLFDERRHEPRDDIATQLVQAGLSQRELDVYFVLLATAGNETTRHTISHGLLALLEHPQEMERLRADPEGLGKTATEEMLRWATPVHHFRRTAAEDTELGGREISAGDKVTTWFVSGNRDETVFEAPERFDVGRTPNPHMTFGPGGVHHCLGAHLAKMEIRITFEELLRRGVKIELTGSPDRLRSNFFNGVKRMPVRVVGGMIGRLHHVALGVVDLDEATARWAAQFGLTVRERTAERAALACDDESYCLELLGGHLPGLHHVGWELTRGTSLAEARERLSDSEEADGSLWTTDTDGHRLQLLPYQEPASGLVAHARPAGGAALGHPRKLGHVNFLTAALQEQLAFYTEVLGMQVTDWLGDGGVWLYTGTDHHVMALVDKDQAHFHHLAFDVVDIGQMRMALDHLGRHGRWLGWGPVRHGIGGNIASYVRIVEEKCFVELYCDMEQLQADHQPRRWPDDRFSSNTWGPLPPRSYFRFDERAIESERDSLEMQGVPL